LPELTSSQIRERQSGIGGSDAASICGVNPYRSAYDVYLEKIGEGTPVVENEVMRWGHLHEDTISKEYAYRTGRDCLIYGDTVHSIPYPFLRCHVDRLQRDRLTERQGVLEIKTTRRRLNKGECPESYVVQLYHNLIVTGHTWGTVAILIQGSELVWYDYLLTPEIESAIVALEVRFWSAVQAKNWLLFGVD
jgi:putative phage-type endonuclease